MPNLEISSLSQSVLEEPQGCPETHGPFSSMCVVRVRSGECPANADSLVTEGGVIFISHMCTAPYSS